MTTTFNSKCDILAELWLDYKGDPNFVDFIAYNDLGLPLAYALSTEIIESSPKSEMFINETFELLLAGVGLSDDGFESLEDVLVAGGLQDLEE